MNGSLSPLANLSREPLPARRIATFAPMTFLENLDIGEDGTMLVTSMLDGRLWLIVPNGACRMLTQVAGRACSVAGTSDGGWLCFGSEISGSTRVFNVSHDGQASDLLDIPACIFPNGVQRLFGDRYLLADSATGTVWIVDRKQRTAAPWLQSDLLAPLPGSPIPGVNGLKVFGGALFATNSSQATIVRVKISDGEPMEDPEIFVQDLGADDFAFDKMGAMYLTTHPFDSVVRLQPDGSRTIVAGLAEGVRGCTACRFGRSPGDETGLYVVSDGGLFNPAAGIEPALVVRIETGIPGAPVDPV